MKPINFLSCNLRISAKKEEQRYKGLLLSLLLGLQGCVFLVFLYKNKTVHLQNEILNQQIFEFSEKQKYIASRLKPMSTLRQRRINANKKRQDLLAHFFKIIAKITPAEIQLLKIQIAQENIHIEGDTWGKKSVLSFVKALGRAGWLSSIHLLSLSKESSLSSDVFYFSITAKLKIPAGPPYND